MDELQNIQDLIYVIRGQRVMLDFDLAKVYQVETKYLKRQVRRNIERFDGEDFMFEVSQEEILRCQNVTSSWGGSRYGAFAFTEIGVAMLSGVLNSKVAVEANRRIMRAFVAYRYLAELPIAATYLELKKEIESVRSEVNDILHDQNDINESTRAQLNALSNALAELQSLRSQNVTLNNGYCYLSVVMTVIIFHNIRFGLTIWLAAASLFYSLSSAAFNIPFSSSNFG